jgi:hypothetical protein
MRTTADLLLGESRLETGIDFDGGNFGELADDSRSAKAPRVICLEGQPLDSRRSIASRPQVCRPSA